MIIVRKAKLGDSEAIATCLLLAMEEIVYHFIGEKDPEKAKEFLWHFVERDNNQYSYQNCWVAANDNKVVAVVNMYDGALLKELRQPVVAYLKERFNIDFKPGDETQAGEYYIDSIGVDTKQQNQGTGTKLLQYLIDEYVIRSSHTVGLLVDEGNSNAKRLYWRLGFKYAGSKVLFGKTMDHLQIKV